MSSVNKVILVGNLGNDPELNYTSQGTPVTNFRMATNERYNSGGKPQTRTTWHRVVVWGKQAVNCAEYLKKGRQVYVEGGLRNREYEVEGSKRYVTEVHAFSVNFLGSQTGPSREDIPPPEEKDSPPEKMEEVDPQLPF